MAAAGTQQPYTVILQPGRLLTLAEYAQLPDEPGWKQELTRGKVIRMPTVKDPRHDWIISRIDRALGAYVEQHGLGMVTLEQVGYNITLPGEEETGWAPDFAFVRAEHAEIVLDAIEQGNYVPLAPDLIVEVVSPSQSRADMAERIQHWLAAGTRLAWVIWRASQTVDVWRVDEPMRTLTTQNT
ncbi:MAG TPA: Uma2 family endonuclease, partial [Ktedonobacterales bacterium]|nr:Uma2 family endonuclease [Ktedonobacterales bacterium]